MRSRLERIISMIAAATGLSMAAHAQVGQPAAESAAPACAPGPRSLPAELAAWTARAPLAAAAGSAGLDRALLTPGTAIDATLIQTADMHYVIRPEKPGGSVSYGGLFSFDVRQAGNYRVALGSGAWIDIVKDGKPVTSSAHGHGPECSGIRKMVDFPLTPGHYILQIAANGSPALPMMLARLP